MSRDDLHFRLRLPAELKARIEAQAAENHRSITAEIVAQLSESSGQLARIEAKIDGVAAAIRGAA